MQELQCILAEGVQEEEGEEEGYEKEKEEEGVGEEMQEVQCIS